MSLSLFVYDCFCSCVMPKTQHALFLPIQRFFSWEKPSSHWVSTWKSSRTSINCLQAAPHDPVLNEQERQMLQIFHFKIWRIYKNVKVFCKTRTIPWHFLLTCLQEVSCFSCCDEAYFLLSFICQHGSVSFFLFVIKEKKLWKAGFCLNNESTDCSCVFESTAPQQHGKSQVWLEG